VGLVVQAFYGTILSMQTKSVRSEGWLFLGGGIMLILGELLHPEPPQSAEAMLRMVAGHGGWSAIHLLQFLALLLIFVATWRFAARLTAPWRAALVGSALVGVAALGVALVWDGIGFRRAALAWAGGDVVAQAALARAFSFSLARQSAVLTVGACCFYGIALLLLGAALRIAETRKILAWIGIVCGALFTLLPLASLAGMRLPPLPWYPLMALTMGVWSISAGIAHLRRREMPLQKASA
jgi:hypothetical protein